MNDYQAIQAIYAVRDVAANDGMNAFTIISAYLVVAYFIGPSLSRFQVWAISILYTAFCFSPIFAFYSAAKDLQALNYGGGTNYMVDYPWIVPTIMLAGWVLSIVFMINVRRINPQERKASNA